jgi:hypothetical protein
MATASSAIKEAEPKLLLDLWMHQNTMAWSRLRLLSAVQASALVSNYALKNSIASAAICLIAVASTLVLKYFWEVDLRIRDSYNQRLSDLGFKIGLTLDERRAVDVPLLGSSAPANITTRDWLAAIAYVLIAVDFAVLTVSWMIFPLWPN